MKIGVALSGGGIRGIAHAGVLKRFGRLWNETIGYWRN